MIKAGTKIFNPDGSGGYEITGDIHPHDTLRYSLFKPFGKSPKPEAGKLYLHGLCMSWTNTPRRKGNNG